MAVQYVPLGRGRDVRRISERAHEDAPGFRDGHNSEELEYIWATHGCIETSSIEI